MGRLGFIHEKLDIKILILYILRRLPGTVDPETLAELCQCDSGVGYFDYSDCLAELVITAKQHDSQGGITVELAMSDGVGEIIRLSFLCANEEQAKQVQKNFRRDAEGYYQKIVELLSRPQEKDKKKQEKNK